MGKITKKVLLEEIKRINELMNFGSKSIIKEDVTTSFFEKLFRGGEEGVSDVVKTIERSGIKGAEDVASAFRNIVERGINRLTEEETIFLSNVIRQVYPSVTNQVKNELEKLLIPRIGLTGVSSLEDNLFNSTLPIDDLLTKLRTDFGMVNLSKLELRVWLDGIKGVRPSEVRIPSTVEVKPKPEEISQPTELKLTPEQKTLSDQLSEEVNKRMLDLEMPNVNTIEEAESWFRNAIKDKTREEREFLERRLNEFQKSKEFEKYMSTMERVLDGYQEILRTQGAQAAEKALQDTSQKIPEKQRKWFLSSVRRALNDPKNAKLVMKANIFFSVCQILYTASQMATNPEYDGLFGAGGWTTIIGKTLIFGIFGWTGGFIYTMVNATLFLIEGIQALLASYKKDTEEKNPNERSIVDKITDKFYITLTEAINYAEAEPPKEEFLTLQDSDELTYALFDENDKEITRTDLKKTGSYVVVYVNGEAMVSLYKVGPVAIKAK
jgi:hypothetical protein